MATHKPTGKTGPQAQPQAHQPTATPVAEGIPPAVPPQVMDDGQKVSALDTPTPVFPIVGIDCPERKQPWGQRVKQALSDYVFNQQVTVDWDKLDRYKRIVGKVLDGQQDVNLALVRDGMCWWYRKYAGEQSPVDRNLYEAVEAKAKEERKGLWVDSDLVPPWEWRRR